MNSTEDIELTIKNIFEIIPSIIPFENLTENNQVAIRMALLNMQNRAIEEGQARAYSEFPYRSHEEYRENNDYSKGM